MKALKTLAIVTAMFASQSVFANTYDNIDLGPPGSYNQVIYHASNDANTWSFTDTFNFTLNSAGRTTGDALDAMYQLKIGSQFVTSGIDTFRVQLFSGNTLLKDYYNTPYDPTATPLGEGYFSFGDLSSGQYRMVVTGQVVSPVAGGYYSVNLNATAVPEPEQYAMMLAGLGLIGFAARRRQA